MGANGRCAALARGMTTLIEKAARKRLDSRLRPKWYASQLGGIGMELSSAIKRFELRFRMASPQALRMIYRRFRRLNGVRPSRSIPAELLSECRFLPSRVDMLEHLPKGGRVAELGTYRGDFAREILNRNDPCELHLVDIDFSRIDKALWADSRVSRHGGFAHHVLTQLPDSFFDWIYVDAEHSYEATLRDALAAAPKLKPGGFLAFNDFAHIDPQFGRYGVHNAVVDFTIEHRWPIRYFAFEGNALYDIALQKP
jgi:hypothetical protein